MPVIKVWCLPSSSESKLNQVFEDIVKVFEDIPELNLKGTHSMRVLFPPDMMKFGLGTEIIIEVTGLFINLQLGDKIFRRLAERLGKTLKEHFPKAMVQCFVFPFDPSQGFWTDPRMGRRHKPTAEDFTRSS